MSVNRLLTASLARMMREKKGYTVGILDADITGNLFRKCTEYMRKQGRTGRRILLHVLQKMRTKNYIGQSSPEDELAPVIWKFRLLRSCEEVLDRCYVGRY